MDPVEWTWACVKEAVSTSFCLIVLLLCGFQRRHRCCLAKHCAPPTAPHVVSGQHRLLLHGRTTGKPASGLSPFQFTRHKGKHRPQCWNRTQLAGAEYKIDRDSVAHDILTRGHRSASLNGCQPCINTTMRPKSRPPTASSTTTPSTHPPTSTPSYEKRPPTTRATTKANTASKPITDHRESSSA